MKLLDNVECRSIFDSYTNGTTKTELAKEYGVSRRTIGRAIDQITNERSSTLKWEVRQKHIANKSAKQRTGNDFEIIGYIFSEFFISITALDHNGEISMHSCDKSHKDFKKCYDKCKTIDKASENAKRIILNDIIGIITPKVMIARFGDIEIRNDKMYYKNGLMLDTRLTKRIIDGYKNKESITHLINFAKRCLKNPDPKAINRLYDFLECNSIKITEKGTFLAYKYVSKDYKDCFSGKFDNRVGQRPNMKREDCDPDDNVTCSRGLHVASIGYINFAIAQPECYNIIVVECDPKDIVSIPIEYLNQKMRICEYFVHHDYVVGEENEK